MSLIQIELPLVFLERTVSAFERIATSLENLEKWFIIPVQEPVYDKSKRHVTDVNWQLIEDIKNLNDDRVHQGLPVLSTEEAAAHLRNTL